jgi:hypothetical protein
MIFVGIEPAAGGGIAGGFRRQMLDIVPCGDDGRFQTARIPPGEYIVHAVGYRTRPRYGPFAAMEASDFAGSAPAFVRLDGNPAEVEIKLVDPSKDNGPAK